MYIYTHTFIYKFIMPNVQWYICMYIYTHTFIYICMHICTHTYMYVYVYTYVYIQRPNATYVDDK